MKRRQSASVQPTSRVQPTGILNKKRAHSITPGEKLERPLVPRKSILKQNPVFDPNDGSSIAATSIDATMSMDITRDFTADIHDNTSRKSLGRRVSFASLAHVRVFENNNNTNSSGAPSSSPPRDSSQSPETHPPTLLVPRLSNENDYPRRQAPRRSSLNSSDHGEESMDLDDASDASQSSPMPVSQPTPWFLSGSALTEEDMDMDGTMDMEEDDDMELTEAVGQELWTPSLAQQSNANRRRSSVKSRGRASMRPSLSGTPASRLRESSDGLGEEPMEFTVPLNKALKKPQPPSEEWLALQAMTGAGSALPDIETSYRSDDSGGESDMELTTALSRLQKARDSRGDSRHEQTDDRSFTSTDDEDPYSGEDIGDRTVNVTVLMENIRMSPANHLADQHNKPVANKSSVLPLNIPPSQRSGSQILPAPPTAMGTSRSQENIPPDSSHVGVVSAREDTPLSHGRSILTTSANVNITTSPHPIATSPKKENPRKRQSSSGEDEIFSAPSPSKKRAVAPVSHLPVLKSSLQSVTQTSVRATADSPSKKTSVFRRPSGYFAQRKSLASVRPTPVAIETDRGSEATEVATPKSATSRSSLVNKASNPVASTEPTQPFASPKCTNKLSSNTAETIEEGPVVEELQTRESAKASELDKVEAMDATAQWRSALLAEEPLNEEDEGPPISIERFFEITGIRFMDELTIPRRSTIRPALLHSDAQEAVSRLSDTVCAMHIDVPQLELYSWVASDLQQWIERSKDNFKQAEEEAALVTPGLFREFSQANEEGREELLHSLKLIKANNHNTAKLQWYEWKYQWIENLCETADKGFVDLISDQSALERLCTQAQNLNPSLRHQHEQVLHELEKEQAENAQIENDDPSYLEELKATIAEQNTMLDHFRCELEEGAAKLDRLHDKLASLEVERNDNICAIDDAGRAIQLQQNSTRAEVFRLRDELETLQALHLWRATRIQSSCLEFIYDTHYQVTIPCVKYNPISTKTQVTLWEGRSQRVCDRFPAFSAYVAHRAQRQLREQLTTKQIFNKLSAFWSSCAQIRSQLTLLAIKFPLKVEEIPLQSTDQGGFKASASILFRRMKSKAVVEFIFDDATVTSWPMSIATLKCEVKITYGSLIPDIVRNAVVQRLEQTTTDMSYACLLDACVEAISRGE